MQTFNAEDAESYAEFAENILAILLAFRNFFEAMKPQLLS
jgi:hypothetical protein